VFLPELFESASFYDAHGKAGSHNENLKSRSPFAKTEERLAQVDDFRTFLAEFVTVVSEA
jgi:hypothetical protein